MDANVLLPLVTLVLGYVGRMLTEYLQDRRVASRDREARAEERARRRKEFQRETLLELQEVMFKFGRAVGAVFHEEDMSYKTTGVWSKPLISEEWNQRLHEATVRFLILMVRVEDETLRRLVAEVKGFGDRVIMAKSHDEALSAMSESLKAFELANARLGELLREPGEPG